MTKKIIDEHLNELIVTRKQWNITSNLSVNINPETNFFIINQQGNIKEVSRKQCVNLIHSIIDDYLYTIWSSPSNNIMICSTLSEAIKIVTCLKYQHELLSADDFILYLNKLTGKINKKEDVIFEIRIIQKFSTLDDIKSKGI